MWHPPLLQLTGESNRRSAAVHYPQVHIRNLDQVRVSLLQISLCTGSIDTKQITPSLARACDLPGRVGCVARRI